MTKLRCNLVYLATLLVSVVAALVAGTKQSPPLMATALSSAALGIIYVFESLKGKFIAWKIPFLQVVVMFISVVLVYLVHIDCYPGFITGVLPYPVLGGAAVACLIAYCKTQIHRELIMVFTMFFSWAISNLTGVIIYAMYESEFDKLVNNALNTKEFVAASVVSLIAIFIFWGYSKYIHHLRRYNETNLLEVFQ